MKVGSIPQLHSGTPISLSTIVEKTIEITSDRTPNTEPEYAQFSKKKATEQRTLETEHDQTDA